MLLKTTKRIIALWTMFIAPGAMIYAETVGLFYDRNIAQISFAAGDIKSALESKKFEVEILPLSSLDTKYKNKKIVLALAADNDALKVLKSQKETLPTGLSEQAYALRTTKAPNTS